MEAVMMVAQEAMVDHQVEAITRAVQAMGMHQQSLIIVPTSKLREKSELMNTSTRPC